MRRHLNGRRITLAGFCLLAYIFAGHVQADSLPMNLTSCYNPVIELLVSDLSVKGTVLISYRSDIVISYITGCKSDYLMINSSASEIVLNSNLTNYCNPVLQCRMTCIENNTHYGINLLINILRNASYTMEFVKPGYSASTRELTSETAILPSFKNELTIRACSEGSLISSPTFNISQSTKPDWFTFRQSTTAGIIYSTALVDYEQLNATTEVIVTICSEQALDNTGTKKLIAYTNLTVTIIDVDDMNPVFTADVYHLNISEANSELSGNPYKTFPPIHAYDGDRGINEIIIYSIEGEMKSKFSINNMSGEIYVLQELDADGGRDLYVMIIKASQQTNTFRTATSTLSLHVTDIDDNPPIFAPNNYNCNITEHSAVGQVICRVTATDKDKGENGQFTYELANGTAVDIDPISGYIHVKDSQMLDREEESYLFFQVLAKSLDGDKTDKANVTINLIDINDNNPVFNQSSFNFSVQNISTGDYVGKISAFDLDSGDNQKLNYTLGTCLSNTGICSGESTKCHFPFLIDPGSGNITLQGCTAGCIYSALVSVCDSPHYFSRFCSTTLLVIRVEDSSTLPIFNRAIGNTSTSLHCSPVYPDSTTAPTSEATGSTVLIISTVAGSVLAVIVVGVILHYCLTLRRRRAKYEKKIRETAYAEMQEMEGQKENYSNIEEVYDEITDLPDDYLTTQDITPKVDESEDGERSYEKLSNAAKNASEGYTYLNKLTTTECESKARKDENIEQRPSTGGTDIHYQKPDDDYTNTNEDGRQ